MFVDVVADRDYSYGVAVGVYVDGAGAAAALDDIAAGMLIVLLCCVFGADGIDVLYVPAGVSISDGHAWPCVAAPVPRRPHLPVPHRRLYLHVNVYTMMNRTWCWGAGNPCTGMLKLYE